MVWRISDGSGQLLILDRSVARLLSGPEAALAVHWTMRAVPDQNPEASQICAGLGCTRIGGFAGTTFGWPNAEADAALSEIEDALRRGDLIALEVPSTAPISQAELDMLEALRRKRSRAILAPPPRYQPPPPEVPLHQYRIRVIDDTGAPVSGAKLKLEIDGTPRMPVTDGNGMAMAEWFSTASALVRVLELPDLARRLSVRFSEPRSDGLPIGPNVFERALGAPFAELRAPVDEETTIILARHTIADWIELEVIDQTGAPYPGCPYAFTMPDGSVRKGITNRAGLAREEGVRPGLCKVTCPFAEQTATTYTVRKGDHLPAIAEQFGYANADDIWLDANNEDLRTLRASPNILLEGDQLHLPKKESGSVERSTGARHRFIVQRTLLRIRLRLLDLRGGPADIDRASLSVDGADISQLRRAGNLLEADIPQSAKRATLRFGNGDDELSFWIGGLDPIDEPSGWQSRLAALGYLVDASEEPDEAELQLALQEFQADHALEISGTYDATTSAALQVAYGC